MSNPLKPADKVREYYENNLRDVVDNRPEPVRDQVAAAMKTVPGSAGELDAWFRKEIAQPPVSHDTQLYNALHQAKEDWKKLLSPAKPA